MIGHKGVENEDDIGMSCSSLCCGREPRYGCGTPNIQSADMSFPRHTFIVVFNRHKWSRQRSFRYRSIHAQGIAPVFRVLPQVYADKGEPEVQ